MTDFTGFFQMLRAFLYLNIIMLAACGIKPGSVDSPAAGQPDTYPRTYPDLNTDPSVKGK